MKLASLASNFDVAMDNPQLQLRVLRSLETSLRVAKRTMPLLVAMPVEEADKSGKSPSFQREKYISETALLLYAASFAKAKSSILEPLIADIATELLPHARSEWLLTTMRLRPVMASELAVAHACLTFLGFQDPIFQAEVELVLQASVAGMFERAPWKNIEAHWFRRIAGIGVVDGVEAIADECLINKGLDALSAKREDIYAFTHALIYITNFGQNSGKGYLSRSTLDLVYDADAALARCLDDDDLDPAAELLLTWPYLRAPWSPAATFGLSVLLRVESQVGILPSLSLRFDEYVKLDKDKRAQYAATEGYHTAYVMGLICAALLASNWLPALAPSGSSSSQYADQFYRLLLPREPIPQWEVDYADLPQEQKEDLVPFLVSIGLRRALMQKNFPRFHEILSASLGCGLLPIPAVKQAAELWLRLARTPGAAM